MTIIEPESAGSAWGRAQQQEAAISIHRFLKEAVFEPSDIETMATAYDNACRVLQVADGARIVREVIASHVIALARAGVRDPEKLEAQTLEALNLAPTG